jgi:NAD(P)-dependent dehydrogenase (short-subunit alcohol dehydrogenase family)
VLITGGAGGLGAAVTTRFLEDGHNVAVASRPSESSETLRVASARFGDQLHVLPADVTDPDSVARLVDETVSRCGVPHVLVHLVGGWAGGEAVQDTAPETWERMQRLNLYSAFLCSRAVLPFMRNQNWGRIVFISARAARNGRKHQTAYAVAKAGVSILAEAIAEENADHDVTANVVAPSVLDTPANRDTLVHTDHSRLVPVEDVARMITFLASDEAGQLRGAWLSAFGQA